MSDARTRALWPFILRIFADAGDESPRAALAASNTGIWAVEIVKHCELHTFAVMPKRWIIERTLAWDQSESKAHAAFRTPCANRCRIYQARHDQDHTATLMRSNPRP